MATMATRGRSLRTALGMLSAWLPARVSGMRSSRLRESTTDRVVGDGGHRPSVSDIDADRFAETDTP